MSEPTNAELLAELLKLCKLGYAELKKLRKDVKKLKTELAKKPNFYPIYQPVVIERYLPQPAWSPSYPVWVGDTTAGNSHALEHTSQSTSI